MADEPNPAEVPAEEESAEPEGNEPEENGEKEATEQDGSSWDGARAKADLAKKNREAQNLRKRLKEAEEKASKYDDLENAQKSESEKLNEKAADLEKRAVGAEQEAARLRVALKKGLTQTQAKRLVGENEEELEADADELLESFKPAEAEKDENDGEDQESDPTRRPKERLRPGAAPSAEPEKGDPKSLASRVSHDW